MKVRRIAVIFLTFIFLLLVVCWSVRDPRGDDRGVEITAVRTAYARLAGLAAIREATTRGRGQSVVDTGASVSRRQSGYLVILNIPEQVTSALEDFVQLYMVNQKHWKLGMIEPYVLGTWLSFVPPLTEDFTSLPLLSTYLNKSHMVHNLRECFHSDVELNTFQDFLINAARAFIVVTFVTKSSVVMDRNISECYFPMNETENLLNYHLQRVKEQAMAIHGPQYQFVGNYSLCIKSRPQEPFSMLKAVKYVQQWMMKASGQSSKHYAPQYTVVIPQWRSIKNQSGNHFYYDPSFTTTNFTGPCQLKSVAHSSYVTTAASVMFDTLALPRPLIAFHVRSERIASQELQNHVEGFIDDCVVQISRVLEAVQRKYNVSRGHIVFTHDGSEYGSNSMWGGRRNASRYIVSQIKALGIQNVQYKPVKRTSVDLAAAQFVEKEFLVSADVLILAGFGSFQRSLIARFRSKVKGGNKWFRVCSQTPENDHLPGLDL